MQKRYRLRRRRRPESRPQRGPLERSMGLEVPQHLRVEREGTLSPDVGRLAGR